MRRVHEKAPAQLGDLRKRFAKEFTEGFLTKGDFDVVEGALRILEKTSAALEKKHGKAVQ